MDSQCRLELLYFVQHIPQFELNVINVIIRFLHHLQPIFLFRSLLCFCVDDDCTGWPEKSGMKIGGYGICYASCVERCAHDDLQLLHADEEQFQMEGNSHELLCNLSKAIKSKLDFDVRNDCLQIATLSLGNGDDLMN